LLRRAHGGTPRGILVLVREGVWMLNFHSFRKCYYQGAKGERKGGRESGRNAWNHVLSLDNFWAIIWLVVKLSQTALLSLHSDKLNGTLSQRCNATRRAFR